MDRRATSSSGRSAAFTSSAGRAVPERFGRAGRIVRVRSRPPASHSRYATAPEGALYHRAGNDRFDRLLADAAGREDVQLVVLPRVPQQAASYVGRPDLIVPERPVEGRSLLAHADLMIGAGGTMNREAALLGTPTYTVFAQRLAAVDAELMRRGLLRDLRQEGVHLVFAKKPARDPTLAGERAEHILGRILHALEAATADKR